MYSKDLEEKLRGAVGRLTPRAIDGILEKCAASGQNVYVMQPARPYRRTARVLGALAAALALTFGGIFTVNTILQGRVDALVMLDVNPSIELRVNRDERVILAEAKNADAVTVLDSMDLKNTHIDVAVNAIIGSMLKFGYIRENANSVLLSVEGVNGEKNAELQEQLAQSISRQLTLVNGAVLSQNLTSNSTLQALAEQHQISYGKAALVQKILDVNSHLRFEDLAKLPVNELNLLVGSKQIEAEGMQASGLPSDNAYIGEERARQTALEHAGIDEGEISRLHTELDYDDGLMVYDVEFYLDSIEFEYEINATDGGIIGYSQENKGSQKDGAAQAQSSAPPPQAAGDFIGEEQAAALAAGHAGAAGYTALKAELDKDDGIYIYEIEFRVNETEYDYEVNATTGEILSYDIDG